MSLPDHPDRSQTLEYLRAFNAIQDFHLCREFLSFIDWRDPLSFEKNQAYEIAFIVVYARNFVRGNEKVDRTIPSTLPLSVIEGVDEGQAELHHRIVRQWRNKLVAHTELGHIKPFATLFGAPGAPRSAEHERAHILRLMSKEDVEQAHKLVRAVEGGAFGLIRKFGAVAPAGTYHVSEA